MIHKKHRCSYRGGSTGLLIAHAFLTSALAHRGQDEEAQQALNGLKQRQPGITTTFVRKHLSVLNTEYMDHLIDGLRKAGLPE